MRCLILSGGSGFHMLDEFSGRTDRWLVEYVRRARGVEKPKVLLIGIADGDKEWVKESFTRSFTTNGCETSTLDLICNEIDLGIGEEQLLAMNHDARAKLVRQKVRELVLAQDLIVVAGGNTDLLLYMLRRHQLDRTLYEAYEHGIVMFGLSAGALYATVGGTTDSEHATALAPLTNGLCWLEFPFNPHHDKGLRRQMFWRLMREGVLPREGYAADDGVSLVFQNEELAQVVSDRPDAYAYLVECRGEEVHEKRFPTALLP